MNALSIVSITSFSSAKSPKTNCLKFVWNSGTSSPTTWWWKLVEVLSSSRQISLMSREWTSTAFSDKANRWTRWDSEILSLRPTYTRKFSKKSFVKWSSSWWNSWPSLQKSLSLLMKKARLKKNPVLLMSRLLNFTNECAKLSSTWRTSTLKPWTQCSSTGWTNLRKTRPSFHLIDWTSFVTLSAVSPVASPAKRRTNLS